MGRERSCSAYPFPMQEIEILRTGTHTSKSGATLTVTDQDLNDVVRSYDPANFQAPLIISHDTNGVPDKKLINTKFAYGAPKALRRVGDRIRAVFDKVAPEFLEWVKKGNLMAVSPSLYLPSSPNNPTPGKLSLRHIAALGAEPPAIKGMAPLASTLALSESCFSEEEEGAESLEFSASELDFMGEGDRIQAKLWQSLREWIISKFDMEAADKALPSFDVGMLAQIDDSFFNRMLSDLSDRVSRLELKEPCKNCTSNYQESPMGTDDKTVDLSDREAALAKREQELYRKEFLSFCETELKGRLIPAIAPHGEVAEFMTWLANQEGEINFSEESKLQPLAWFKGFLSRLPQQVPMGKAVPEDFMEDKAADEDPDKEAKAQYENAWKSKA